MVERFIHFLKGEKVHETTWNGVEYRLRGKGTGAEFDQWFNEYAPKAPVCISCNRIIFPGTIVGRCEEGFMHLGSDCCPDGSYFVGRIDQNGQLIKAFEEGLTAAHEVFRTGKSVYINSDEKGIKIDYCDPAPKTELLGQIPE
jgi:hypothetical protein